MKFIIVSEDTDYSPMFKVLFNDIFKYNKGIFISSPFNDKSKIKLFLFKVLYKKEINKYLNSKFEAIIRPKFKLLEEIENNKSKPTVVVFNNTSINKYYNKYTLLKVKERYPYVKFVLYFVDPVFQCIDSDAFKLASSNIFDLVYTYSKPDAQKYNFIYYPTPYSKIIDEPKNYIKGVFFCGNEKGRTELLKKVAVKLKSFNIPYNFYVEGEPEHSNRYFKVNNEEVKKYDEVIKATLNYSCILDLTQKSSKKSGLSLRAYEALVYNRILITNNPLIKEFKYYDPITMHYISNVSEIKKSWITMQLKNKIINNPFSPINFIKDVEQKLDYRGENKLWLKK